VTKKPPPPLRKRTPPQPPKEFDSWYDATDEDTDDSPEPAAAPRRSKLPDRVRESSVPIYADRRARSVEPIMLHRRKSSTHSDSASTIDSDAESFTESGYGSFSQKHDATKPALGGVIYDSTATDYSKIIREVEADYQAAKRMKSKEKRLSMRDPGSAGSGISVADSGYGSGPQVLVPNGEDLWS
jgi:hypothetical protein